ncbi:MAG: hypothetical protein IPG91_00855 [Ideonella sp.]|nr:hypothetical protein [Ideonella sp.]
MLREAESRAEQGTARRPGEEGIASRRPGPSGPAGECALRFVPTGAFEQDVERVDGHVVQRELANRMRHMTGLDRLRDAVERVPGSSCRHRMAVADPSRSRGRAR